MLSPRALRRKTQHRLLALALAALGGLACNRHQTPTGLPGVGDRGGSWPGGVGAVLRFRESEGLLVVHAAPPDGAAARAGLRVGDAVVAIDGHPVAGSSQPDVVARLRGEVGTTVTLRVRRDGTERDYPVERAPYRQSEGRLTGTSEAR